MDTNRIRNEFDANRQIIGTPHVPAWMVPAPRKHAKPARRGFFDWFLALVRLV